jgi:hypothetical protein
VISQRTVQKIDDIYPGREKETIYVACGYSDQLSEEPHLTGDTFTLEKINDRWTVVDKRWWIRSALTKLQLTTAVPMSSFRMTSTHTLR